MRVGLKNIRIKKCRILLVCEVDNSVNEEAIEKIFADIKAINDTLPSEKKVQDILIEVRLGDEETAKTGCDQYDLEDLSEWIRHKSHLRLRGLMLIPPIEQDPAETRKWFSRITDFAAWMCDRNDMSVLSYGMSGDFEIAIEEDSTCVRIGTAIFGARG